MAIINKKRRFRRIRLMEVKTRGYLIRTLDKGYRCSNDDSE